MKKNLLWVPVLVLVAAVSALPAAQRLFEADAAPQLQPAQAVQRAPDTVNYPAGAPQLAMLRTQAVAGTPVPLADALSARVAYDEDVTARIFPPVAGRIARLRAEPGDRVTIGQPLAEIDSPDFGTALADAEKARTDEARKRLAYERAQDLGPGEGIAAKDLESARADYEAARAEARRAQQRLDNLNPRTLKVDGQRVTLTSPFSGVVAERNATPALEVSAGMGTPLFVVTDPRHLWLLVDVPERLLPSVRVGSQVDVESDAYPGDTFHARIVQVGQTVDPNTRRIVARARLDNPKGALLPEMFVRARLLQDTGRGMRVPNSAVVTRGVYPCVFVELGPGSFQLRRVELAARGAETSYVVAGLHDGEKIVTTGALLLESELGSGGPS